MMFNHRAGVICALTALALGLSACGSDSNDPAQSESNTAPTAQPTQETPPSDGDSGPESEGRDGMDVTVVGDQGVLALQYPGSVPEGDAGPANGKLITGPGGCFALTNNGPPQLLVFPEEATFILKGGKPSVTIEGVETKVGQQVSVETTKVSISRVTGIPERCSHGPSDTALVVG